MLILTGTEDAGFSTLRSGDEAGRLVTVERMTDFMDQCFVLLKHWLVGLFPAGIQPLLSVLLSIVPIMLVFALLFGVTTVIERKAIGRIQNRYGPNRVGLPFTDLRLFGFGQFIADGIKIGRAHV